MLRLWAEALVRLGDHAGALDKVRQVLDRSDDPDPRDLWAVVIAGSALGAWTQVRDAGIALGWAVEPGDDPVDEPVERCFARFPDGSRMVTDREGPAIGTVVEIARPVESQRFGFRVLLRPQDLEAGEQLACYQVLDVLDSPEVSTYQILAASNGAETWWALASAIEAAGGAVWIHERDFMITDPADEDATREGLWGSVAIADPADVQRVWDVVHGYEWDGPLLAADLAAATGDAETAAKHHAETTAWGF